MCCRRHWPTDLYKLEAKDIREWRRALPENLAPGTVRRLTNDLKAALNRAAVHHRAQLPAEIEGIIRDGLKVDEARSPEARRQVLPEDDVPRLIKAAKLSPRNLADLPRQRLTKMGQAPSMRTYFFLRPRRGDP